MSWGLNKQIKPENKVFMTAADLPDDRIIFNGLGFYQAPNNTACSMAIPLAMSPQPVALVTVKRKNDALVVLRASIGWKTPGCSPGIMEDENRIKVLFEIRRETSVNGELICSVIDSCTAGFDNYTATSFEHVDSGVPADTASDYITYTLAAQQLNQPEIRAEIIGCLTLTALCVNFVTS